MDQKQEVRLKSNSKIQAFLLNSQPARAGKIFIGSRETNSYVIVDACWKPIVELLLSEMPVSEIAKKLSQIDPESFCEEDVLDKTKIIIMGLAKHKMIKKIDGEVIFRSLPKEKMTLNPIVEKAAFFVTRHIPILMIVTLALFALLTPLVFPETFPRPSDFYWSKYLSFCIASSFIFTWVSVFLHEGAHLIIARKYGLNGKLRISHRLNFLVVETYFPDIYSIPKKGRMAIYISGMIIDMAIISLFYICIFLINSKFTYLQGLVLPLKQFILLQWLSILWQFFFYMKTDFYFVIKEFVGIENLYTFAKEKMLNMLKFRQTVLPITKKEIRIVNIYTIFFLIGNILGVARYVFYHLPILAIGIMGGVEEIRNGIKTSNIIPFADGLVFVTVELFFTALLARSIIKERKRGSMAYPKP